MDSGGFSQRLNRPAMNRLAKKQRPLKRAYAAGQARFSGRC